MKKLKSLLVGGLALVLAISLAVACAPAAPPGEEAAEEIAELEAEIDELEDDLVAEKAQTKDLKAEIAALKKPAEVFKWRTTTHQMVGTPRYEGTVAPFCESVKEASDGRLVIEPYGAGVLFPVFDTFDNLRDGVVEMSMVWNGYWGGKDPVFALAGTRPGDPITTFSENFYLSEQLAPLRAEVFAKYGIKALGGFDIASVEILCSTVPIRTLDDFEGLNIRTAGIGASFYPLLGASAVSLSMPEIYPALQLGTVDAAEYNDYLVNGTLGFHEVTKYVIDPCLHMGTCDDKELAVNPAAWAELPDDLKALVIVARDQARYKSAIAYYIGNEKAKLEWIEAGVEIINLPEEDVTYAREVLAVGLLLEYAEKSPEAAEFIAIFARALNDLGYFALAEALGY